MTKGGFVQDMNLFFAEMRRSVKLLKTYPIDTINSIISFIIMSVVFMIGIKAVGDPVQVFGVVFFPVMLNLISGPAASIRGDIELGVFEQVYISRYSLIKIAIIRSLISGLTSVVGSLMIAVIMHLFFLKLNISALGIIFLFFVFGIQSVAVGVIMAALTLRFRKVDTLLNFINILIMIELVLPLNNITSFVGSVMMTVVPFFGVVVSYQQILCNWDSNVILSTIIFTLINTVILVAASGFIYKKSLIASKKRGMLGQY